MITKINSEFFTSIEVISEDGKIQAITFPVSSVMKVTINHTMTLDQVYGLLPDNFKVCAWDGGSYHGKLERNTIRISANGRWGSNAEDFGVMRRIGRYGLRLSGGDLVVVDVSGIVDVDTSYIFNTVANLFMSDIRDVNGSDSPERRLLNAYLKGVSSCIGRIDLPMFLAETMTNFATEKLIELKLVKKSTKLPVDECLSGAMYDLWLKATGRRDDKYSQVQYVMWFASVLFPGENFSSYC